MTVVGLVLGFLTLLTGGKHERRNGVLEFRNGFARELLKLWPLRASAITVGHVIIGRDARCLHGFRDHEHGHVRQMERWGIFFMPAYLAASLWARLRGRHPYRDNWFEVDAERHAASCAARRS